jgi:hypothetical protein
MIKNSDSTPQEKPRRASFFLKYSQGTLWSSITMLTGNQLKRNMQQEVNSKREKRARTIQLTQKGFTCGDQIKPSTTGSIQSFNQKAYDVSIWKLSHQQQEASTYLIKQTRIPSSHFTLL